jgi:hypothetical protein
LQQQASEQQDLALKSLPAPYSLPLTGFKCSTWDSVPLIPSPVLAPASQALRLLASSSKYQIDHVFPLFFFGHRKLGRSSMQLEMEFQSQELASLILHGCSYSTAVWSMWMPRAPRQNNLEAICPGGGAEFAEKEGVAVLLLLLLSVDVWSASPGEVIHTTLYSRAWRRINKARSMLGCSPVRYASRLSKPSTI